MDDLASELEWLAEEFESLSYACQNEYGFPGDKFEEERQRARAVLDAMKRHLAGGE